MSVATVSVSTGRDAISRARQPLALGVGGPAALLAVLLAVPVLNARLELLTFHMLLVLAAAAFTAVVTVWMGLVGLRGRLGAAPNSQAISAISHTGPAIRHR